MDLTPLTQLAGLVALGVIVQWISAAVRLPSIVLLLAAGLLLGPITGIIQPRLLLGGLIEPMVGLAVALVLFEGGLSLRFEEARRLGAPLWALVFGGLVVSFTLTTTFGVFLADLSWPVAAVIGAILVVTGPTVIKPMLRLARLSQRPARLLRWEGIVNDPLGALLAVVVLEVALVGAEPGAERGDAMLGLGWRAAGAALGGGVAALCIGRALARAWLPEHLKVPAMVATVLGVYALAEALMHESGLLAVTVLGVALANQETAGIEAIRGFKENVATLLVAMLFLVLSADLTLDDLARITPGAVGLVLAVVFVVRPVAVWLSLAFTGIPRRETLLIGWIAPRGIVAAAMAGALAPQLARAGYEDARLILPVVFGVILTTVLLHGLTVRPLAARLGLAGRSGGGLLLVGVSVWSIELARTLRDAGVDVLLVDGDYRAVLRGRMAGIETFHGDVLSEETLDDLPSERVSWSLAASPDDHYNALACLALGPLIGPDRTLQLTPQRSGDALPHLEGKALWGEAGTFGALSTRYWNDRGFRSTQLTETFDQEAFDERHGDALVLFAIGPKGVRGAEPDDEFAPGTKLVFLP